MMNLVLFDIDGTLTQTNVVSSECFVEAMAQALQITDVETDWTRYRNVTEQGCFDEILEAHKGRPGTEDELVRFKTRFLQLLRDRIDSNHELFKPIAGAGDLLAVLQTRTDVDVALATGAWLESARIKLSRSGLNVDQIPIVSGNDALTRERILKMAEERMKSIVGGQFHSKTYVGDAPWDMEAAETLGFHFIGVGVGKRADDLRARGAKWFVPDFQESKDFLKILDHIFMADPSDVPRTQH